jgi:hypothetical protein
VKKPARSKVADWSNKIKVAWRETVEGIFKVGDLLIRAKAALSEREWIALIGSGSVQGRLPFGYTTTSRLMAIAKDKRLRALAHGQALILPPSWRTLYELSKLTDKELKAGLKSEAISPEMERSDIENMRLAVGRIRTTVDKAPVSVLRVRTTVEKPTSIKTVWTRGATQHIPITAVSYPREVPQKKGSTKELEQAVYIICDLANTMAPQGVLFDTDITMKELRLAGDFLIQLAMMKERPVIEHRH